MIIALLSETCSRVSTNRESQWHLQKLGIILYIEFRLLHKHRKVCGREIKVTLPGQQDQDRLYLEIKSLITSLGVIEADEIDQHKEIIEDPMGGDKSPQLGKNKINCLEVLVAVVLRGILQGYIYQQQVGSQVFMKAYRKLLTQVGSTVSLDSSGLLSLATPIWSDGSIGRHAKQWANRSGEVIGVSEEGYLQVAVHSLACRRASQKVNSQTVSTQKVSQPTTNSISADNILLFKPSEIHIS